jgi:hypothetical protein
MIGHGNPSSPERRREDRTLRPRREANRRPARSLIGIKDGYILLEQTAIRRDECPVPSQRSE